MSEVNIALQNFAGGELSSRMRGRFELPVYQRGCEKLFNFWVETQGSGKFRTGTRFVTTTRRNNVAVLIPFQFNDSQAYLLELTAGYMRFFKDEGVIVESTKTITGITAATPPVVTSAGHGYANGDEVFIDGVVGMTELNGRSFIVTNKAANTFELYDNDAAAIVGVGYTAYASGGTAARVVEITTPYAEADLFQLKYGQNADTMYIVHENYEPRKLTRSSHTAWSLALFTRTNDPFTSQKVITGITAANPGNVTAVAHGLATGDEIIIETVVGMTQVNGRVFTITVTGVDNFTIGVDTSAYTAWSSGGYASKRNLLPSAFAFYEGRSAYGGSDSKPETFWLSRSPTSAGVSRYDDFTTGADADHAVIFTLAPTNGKVDKIEWLAGTDRFLAAGTFGGISKITGNTDDDAISPSSITVRPLESPGVADMVPVKLGGTILYIHRNQLTAFSLEFDVLADGFKSQDQNIVAEHILQTGVVQTAFQSGRPDIMWAVRTDGVLVGLTYKSAEEVSGWHRSRLGGIDAEVGSVGVIPVPTAFDQIWVVAKRTLDGHTRRYVEFFTEEALIPEKDDLFTDEANSDTDDEIWRRAMFEAQKEYVHVDSALTYDGTDAGRDAGAGVTPAAVTGTGITFTASAAVFKSTDVGRQIWKKAIDGVGYGRATITGYTDTTHVVCTITVDFNNATIMAAGDWYLTTDTIGNLHHLEGEEVAVIADGGDGGTFDVVDGEIELGSQVSKAHVGLSYFGILKPMALEIGGFTGPARSKPTNVNRIGIQFRDTLGAKYGTSLYRMQEIPFRSSEDATNRPPPLFNGVKTVPYEDETANEKYVYILQTKPLPCVVQCLVIYAETDNS